MKRLLCSLLIALTSAVGATTLNPVQLLNPTGSTSGQAIVSNGASSAPTWGAVGVNGIAPIAANTVLANATASSASPTAFAVPSCSTSASALNWTTSTGFTCNTAVNAAQLGGATFASPSAIGGTTPSSGAFTTLSASSTVSGTGFSTYFASPPAIGGTAAAAGSFTTLSASGAVSGAGFSNYLLSPPAIGTTAPAAGKFTTLQATGAITPSTTAGIVGTTLADSANAGSVGEYITATGTSVSLTSGTAANITSISLTAGDWDVWGNVQFLPAGTTTQSQAVSSVNTTSATQSPTTGALGISAASIAAGLSQSVSAPMQRINLSVTTTVYLVATGTFAVSTETASGFIAARRVR